MILYLCHWKYFCELVTYGDIIITQLEESCAGFPGRSQNLEILLIGKIRISQWIKAKSDDIWHEAEFCFRFGIAIMTRNNSTGKDKMIPVRLGTGSYTWFIIEDKNNEVRDVHIQDANNLYSVRRTFEIIPELPYLVIYSQFGECGSRSVENCFQGARISRDDKSGAYADNMFKFIVSVSGLSFETYPFLETLPESRDSDFLGNLKILRDGSFRIETKNLEGNMLEYWHEVEWKYQNLHDIIRNKNQQ